MAQVEVCWCEGEGKYSGSSQLNAANAAHFALRRLSTPSSLVRSLNSNACVDTADFSDDWSFGRGYRAHTAIASSASAASEVDARRARWGGWAASAAAAAEAEAGRLRVAAAEAGRDGVLSAEAADVGSEESEAAAAAVASSSSGTEARCANNNVSGMGAEGVEHAEAGRRGLTGEAAADTAGEGGSSGALRSSRAMHWRVMACTCHTTGTQSGGYVRERRQSDISARWMSCHGPLNTRCCVLSLASRGSLG